MATGNVAIKKVQMLLKGMTDAQMVQVKVLSANFIKEPLKD